MRDTKTVCLHGKLRPKIKVLALRIPSSNDCRSKLRNCGLLPIDLNLTVEEIDERGWHAETNSGPREIRWHATEGWRITKTPPGGSP
jgi:hypothetical protein